MNNITTTFVTLKGRGLHAYIKGKKKKGRYYKIRQGTTVEPYIEYYRQKFIRKGKKTLNQILRKHMLEATSHNIQTKGTRNRNKTKVP